MRIIAGRHRGRRLVAPSGEATRPTSDRAREALMSILEHGQPPLRGARFLDLFAGSGAVGLEAASRGAAEVLMVENAEAALAAARANLEQLKEGPPIRIRAGDATRLGRAATPFDIVFLDPPYRSGLAGPALEALLDGGWLTTDSRVVVELGKGEPFAPPLPLIVEDERRYGAARFVFLRVGTAR